MITPPAALPDLDARKAAVLRAVISEFVASGEPVGSSRVVAAAGLDVSAATVRSDMGALEEFGLIEQPHTSAGRVPTEKGYRWFVDHALETAKADSSQRRFIRDLLGGATDAEDLLQRSVTALAQLTRLVALVLAPRRLAARVKLLEIVQLAPSRLLVVIADDTGRVHSDPCELDEPAAAHVIDVVRSTAIDAVLGEPLEGVTAALGSVEARLDAPARALCARIRQHVASMLADVDDAEVMIAGRDALATQQGLDRNRLGAVLRTLDDTPAVASILRDAQHGDGVIRIGTEHELEALTATALVGATIGVDHGTGAPAGSVGVLGPVRMDYIRALATVRAVADELHAVLASPQPNSGTPTTADEQ